jgi:hypothetical protein
MVVKLAEKIPKQRNRRAEKHQAAAKTREKKLPPNDKERRGKKSNRGGNKARVSGRLAAGLFFSPPRRFGGSFFFSCFCRHSVFLPAGIAATYFFCQFSDHNDRQNRLPDPIPFDRSFRFTDSLTRFRLTCHFDLLTA